MTPCVTCSNGMAQDQHAKVIGDAEDGVSMLKVRVERGGRVTVT